MTLPINCELNHVSDLLILSTPFHSAVVDWAHRRGGHWDNKRRVWALPFSVDARDAFSTLCWAVWPNGVAVREQWQRGGSVRAALSKGSERSEPSERRCARCPKPIYGDIMGVNLAVCPDCWTAIVDYVDGMRAGLLVTPGAAERSEPSVEAKPIVTPSSRNGVRAALAK